MDISSILKGYDTSDITVGVLGGHSALDVSHGAKQFGFNTVCIAREGREKTFEKYYKTNGEKGCIDTVIVKKDFDGVLDADVQGKLRKMNTIFVHNRYFWVYFDDFSQVENNFEVPIFGSRTLLKIEISRITSITFCKMQVFAHRRSLPKQKISTDYASSKLQKQNAVTREHSSW